MPQWSQGDDSRLPSYDELYPDGRDGTAVSELLDSLEDTSDRSEQQTDGTSPDDDQPAMASGEEGASLLDELERFVLRFGAFPSEHYGVALTLWIAHTHCVDAFEVSPRLALVSETKQTGKSRVLEVIDLTASRPKYVAAASVAYLFRCIDDSDSGTPTLLFDEVDTIFGPRARDNEELRALINVGFRRTATIGRCVGDGSKQKPMEFKVFAPMALAGIGDCLPDTVLDRAVLLRMRRRAPDERVEPLRYRRVRPEAAALKERLAAWGATRVEHLTIADPQMPEGITDRPADTWEALLAIADDVGGDWPDRARTACVFLNDARSSEDGNVSVRLLLDLCGAIQPGERLVFSQTFCDRLNEMEEAPWAGWNDGAGIHPRDLARRLRGFGAQSKKVRIGADTRQGYEIPALEDIFVRYGCDNRNNRNTRNTPASDVPDVPHVPDDDEGEQC
jgi:hypothetical protein